MRTLACALFGFLLSASSTFGQQVPVVASGDDFTAIVNDSGELYLYGANNPSGPLLIEPEDTANTWTSVAVSPTAYDVAHILAVQSDGSLWAWGQNNRGQLGNDTTVASLIPVQVSLSNVTDVACGAEFSLARLSSGELFVWGDNTFGQIGLTIRDKTLVTLSNGQTIEAGVFGSSQNIYNEPVAFDSSNLYDSIATSRVGAVAVRSDGSLYAWGYGESFQLGLGSSQQFPIITPVRVGSSNAWTRVFSGEDMHFGLQGGALYAWGAGSGSQDGLGRFVRAPREPTRVGTDSDWEEIAIGSTHALAIKQDGSLYGWGSNTEGQLGFAVTDLDSQRKWTPYLLPDQMGQSFLAIGAGDMFSTIILDSSPSDTMTTGVNDLGQLGRGDQTSGSDYDFANNSIDFDLLYSVDLSLGSIALIADPSRPEITDPSTSLVAGGQLYFSVEMSNLGLLDLTQDFQISAKLSPTPSYDDPDALPLVLADGADVTSDIAAETSSTFGLRAVLPTAIDSGDYYIVVRGDSGTPSVLGESASARVNNDTASESTLSFVPDIAVTVEVLDSEFILGDGINARVTLENVGSWTALSGFELTSVFATTPFFNGSNVQELGVSSGNAIISEAIDPGETLVVDLSLSVPASVVDSEYFLIVRADDAGILAEEVFENNDALAAGSFDVGLDLEITSLIPQVELPVLDDDFEVTVFIANNGSRDLADSFNLRAVLSPSMNFDDPKSLEFLFEGSQSTYEVSGGIAAGQSISLPITFDFPALIDEGEYFLILFADANEAIIEQDETNNHIVADEVIEMYSDIEFDATAGVLLSSPGVYEVGDSLQIQLNLKNTGDGSLVAGSEFDVSIFLSPTTSDNDPGSVELFSEYTIVVDGGGLDPNESLQVDLTTPLPLGLSADEYFIAAIVDIKNEITEQPAVLDASNNIIRENGEFNNTFFSATTVLEFVGIELNDAVDLPAYTFSREGDGLWFGQSLIHNSDGDAAQSPDIEAGETASFTRTFSEPVLVTFDWLSKTSNAENKLVFRIIGGGNGVTNEISGDSEQWRTVSRLVPEGASVQWEYIKGVDSDDNAVFVDNMRIEMVTQPDLVFDGIDLTEDAEIIESGSYVLLRDQLEMTVRLRNQGSEADPADAVLTVFLSTDSKLDRYDGDPDTVEDIIIRQETLVGPFPGGSPAFSGIVIDLSDDLPSGDYFLIAYIDDYLDEDGAMIPGVPDSNGQIAEFTTPLFKGEENNLYVSLEPVITISTLADLTVSDLNTFPDYYRLKEPNLGTNVLETNSFDLDFTISNTGLSPYFGTIASQVVFSLDEDLDGGDFVLLNYLYSGGLGAADSSLASEETVTPDKIDFSQSLVDLGYIGRRLFLGVMVDSSEEVTELNELNNFEITSRRDFILSELELLEGLDLDSSTISAQNVELINDEFAPFDSGSIPWVGQTTETQDGVDGVMSVKVDDGQTSSFSIDIEPINGVQIEFRWKVSSQSDEFGRDFLRFEVDDEVVAEIAGSVEEWQEVAVVLPAGPHRLTWSYIKDGATSVGEDRGWVDTLEFTDLPNLVLTGITTNSNAVYVDGEAINSWSVTIQNDGEDIAPGVPIQVDVRLLAGQAWDGLGSSDLITITDTTGLGAGLSRTYDQDSHGPLLLPEGEYTQEFYFLGAYVDQPSFVLEFDETDNIAFTASADVQFGRPDLVVGPFDPLVVSSAHEYSANPDFTVVAGIVNQGQSALPAGSEFEIKIYASASNDALLIDSSSSFEIGSFTHTVAADVAPGGSLALPPFSSTLPYGIAVGDYFLGVVVDANNSIEEPGPLPSILAPGEIREDGEANNTYFSTLADFDVVGITLQDALQDGVSVLNTITTSGDGSWFGRSDDGDLLSADDDQSFVDGEGAQSPVLAAGESASFKLFVDTSSVVSFSWGATTLTGDNTLALIVNGVEKLSLSGDTAISAIDPSILVPENSTLVWKYTKGAASVGDVAFVDNIELSANSEPDLALTYIEYTPGTYVLDVDSIDGSTDQKLGTSTLDITVGAENLGQSLPDNVDAFTEADLEVRLSIDQVYGNADDIILGSFTQTEGQLLASGDLLRFIGGIPLGDNVPEGDYYLIAKIDSNDRVGEFSETNNIFITADRDVTIETRPRLIPYSASASISETATTFFTDVLNYDEGIVYTPGGVMRVDFSINNIGLGDLIDDDTGLLQSFVNEVYLVAVSRENLESYINSEFSDGSTSLFRGLSTGANFDRALLIDDFSIQSDLVGRRDGFPHGDSVNIALELTLPNSARLGLLLGDDPNPSEWVYYLRLVIDSDNEVPESGSRNVWNNVNISAIPQSIDADPDQDLIPDFTFFDPAQLRPFTVTDDGLFAIDFGVSGQSDWEAIYGPIGGSSELLLAYAFSRNPTSGDTAGNQFPGSYGFDVVNGESFLSATFDFQYRVTDLKYTIETSSDLLTWTEIAEIDTKATANGFTEGAGSESLLGDGGLIDSDEQIVAITDFGSYARITVIDTESSDGPSDGRFIRVLVESEEVNVNQ
ncbi:MAG: CARDB domain-containing protein [Opitutaceae bacterium]